MKKEFNPTVRIITIEENTISTSNVGGSIPYSMWAPGRVKTPATPTTVNGVLSDVADQK